VDSDENDEDETGTEVMQDRIKVGQGRGKAEEELLAGWAKSRILQLNFSQQKSFESSTRQVRAEKKQGRCNAY
jgi:hypothetical protein